MMPPLSTGTPPEFDALRVQHAKLSSYQRRAPLEVRGTPAHLKIVRPHRVLTDLLARASEPGIMQKAMAKLAEIEKE